MSVANSNQVSISFLYSLLWKVETYAKLLCQIVYKFERLEITSYQMEYLEIV